MFIRKIALYPASKQIHHFSSWYQACKRERGLLLDMLASLEGSVLTYSNLPEGGLAHIEGPVKLSVQGCFISGHIFVESVLVCSFCGVCRTP